MGLRINISRNHFVLLIVILSIVMLVRYQDELLGVFSPYYPNSQQNVYSKEALISTGFKEATTAGSGPGACYIIEPVYAQLRCNRVPLGLGGTQDALKLTPGGILPSQSFSKPIITEIEDWKFPKEIWPWTIVDNRAGKAHKIDWATLSRERYNIEKVNVASYGEDLYILMVHESGVSELWYGCGAPYSHTYCEEDIIPEDIKEIYIFGIESGPTWITTLWTRPYRINTWQLSLTATDEYLTFSIPGALDPTRIPSQGCEVLDKADLTYAIAQKIRDPSSPWSFDTQIPELEDMKEILDRASMEVISQGGAVTEAQDNSKLYNLFKAVFSNDASDSPGPLLDYPEIGNLRQDGDAINWPYLYRNTGIVGDVTPTYYNGEPVLCDQVNKRLVGFIEVPQTPGMKSVGVCYAYPGTKVKDGKGDPRFSCSQTFCDDQWASLGYGTWDPEQFTCAKTGSSVAQQACRGSGDCTPILTQYYPTSPAYGGACAAVSSECVPSSDAPTGFVGFCARSEQKLPVCCPGERTATGLICNSAGTSFVDPVVPKSSCPEGSCCIGDLQYLDSGNINDEYGCADSGKICCANVVKGQTRGTCANTCQNEFVDDTFLDRLVKDIIRAIKGELGIEDTGNLSKFITIALIILAVIAGLILLFLLINLLSGIFGALKTGGGLLAAFRAPGDTFKGRGETGIQQTPSSGVTININTGDKK